MRVIFTRTAMLVLLLIGAALAACGSDDSNPPDNSPASETATSPAGTLDPVLIHLQQDYESLDAAHQAMTAIWEGLAAGEQVQCGVYPEFPVPDGISAEGDPDFESLAESLQSAAIDLDRSVTLWKTECTNPRAIPAPEIVDEGRLATRSAGDALRDASTQLGGIQR